MKTLEILPEEVNCEPLFKTKDEYEKFCEEYREKVVPKLEEQNRKIALSWRDAHNRIVN